MKLRTGVAVAALAMAIPAVALSTSSPEASTGAGVAYHFGQPPIASAGSLGPGQSITFILRVTNNGVPDPGGQVFLGYFQGGHMAGDTTAVPASQCDALQLPTPESFVLCRADAKG